MEERGLRAVEIFRPRLLRQRPPPERHQAPARVGDGKHHPAAEAVIGLAAVLRSDDQPGLDQLVGLRPLLTQRVGEPLAAVRREPQPEALHVAAGKSAALQIGARLLAGRALELADKPALRGFDPLQKRLSLGFGLGRALFGLGDLQPGLGGQRLDRLHEGQALGLLKPGEHVAVLLARKAMVEALFVIDEKARRALFLERRKPCEFTALTFQRHRPPDQVGRADSRLDLVDESVRDRHEFPLIKEPESLPPHPALG